MESSLPQHLLQKPVLSDCSQHLEQPKGLYMGDSGMANDKQYQP
jgi:hypothetical protein